MKRKRFSVEQIILVLKQAELGMQDVILRPVRGACSRQTRACEILQALRAVISFTKDVRRAIREPFYTLDSELVLNPRRSA